MSMDSMGSAEREEYYAAIAKLAQQDRDPGCARELLRAFCEAVENGQPVPRAILEFMRESLAHYLQPGSDTSLEQSFSLTQPKHRPSWEPNFRDWHAVVFMYLLQRRDGYKAQEAKQISADRFHMDVRTLERRIQRFKAPRYYDVAQLEAALPESLRGK